MKMIDNIIADFDFEKVHTYMTLVKWSWWDGKGPNGVPTIDQLKSAARELLVDAYNKKSCGQTGGFCANYFSGINGESLHLHFSIASAFETTES